MQDVSCNSGQYQLFYFSILLTFCYLNIHLAKLVLNIEGNVNISMLNEIEKHFCEFGHVGQIKKKQLPMLSVMSNRILCLSLRKTHIFENFSINK